MIKKAQLWRTFRYMKYSYKKKLDVKERGKRKQEVQNRLLCWTAAAASTASIFSFLFSCFWDSKRKHAKLFLHLPRCNESSLSISLSISVLLSLSLFLSLSLSYTHTHFPKVFVLRKERKSDWSQVNVCRGRERERALRISWGKLAS